MSSGSDEQPIDLSNKNMLLDGDISWQIKMASGSDEQPIDLSNKIMLLDGDISWQIKNHAGTYPQVTELYQHNRTKQDVVYNSHWDFLNSGSNLIRTNTYHALFPYLWKYMPVDVNGFVEVVQRAVKIVKESVKNYYQTNNTKNRSLLSIVGSCGCFNDDYIDSLPLYQLRASHEDRIDLLLEYGVDAISFEGIRSTEEADMLFSLMRDFPNAKFLVMFDAAQMINSCYNIVNLIRNYYNSHSSQITAIGLNNVNIETAIIFCNKINDGCETYNLIPLVMCINKCNPNSWDLIHAMNDNSVPELQRIGLRYIGGGNKVVSDDINAVHEKLYCS